MYIVLWNGLEWTYIADLMMGVLYDPSKHSWYGSLGKVYIMNELVEWE